MVKVWPELLTLSKLIMIPLLLVCPLYKARPVIVPVVEPVPPGEVGLWQPKKTNIRLVKMDIVQIRLRCLGEVVDGIFLPSVALFVSLDLYMRERKKKFWYNEPKGPCFVLLYRYRNPFSRIIYNWNFFLNRRLPKSLACELLVFSSQGRAKIMDAPFLSIKPQDGALSQSYGKTCHISRFSRIHVTAPSPALPCVFSSRLSSSTTTRRASSFIDSNGGFNSCETPAIMSSNHRDSTLGNGRLRRSCCLSAYSDKRIIHVNHFAPITTAWKGLWCPCNPIRRGRCSCTARCYCNKYTFSEGN